MLNERVRIVVVMLLGFVLQATAQNIPQSIHYEQNEYYRQFDGQSADFYDSINGFKDEFKISGTSDCQLQRVVFGFHPYWAGSDYLNYRWNLLSDFCYFSYEVNSSTGEAVSIHDWLTDPAIDSAQAHGVKVHLCATIFSGHTAFFTSISSRQNLITNLVSLVQQRNADGVNMDIEALPTSLGDSVTSFMRDLSVQLKSVMPAAVISIDLPAVNWGNAYDISGLDNYVDLFFIMGYDYYYNGSSQAGPVSPLYSLTSGNNYSLARTISDYTSAGMGMEKFILGVPYYGRKWKTESNNIPSSTLAYGTALTYSTIRSNNGTYNTANYYWEPNSLSSCYIFFQNDSWNQCFIGLDRDLRKKYDLVNYHDLAGIGIWALGYDNGYPDLWQAISDKFSDCYVPLRYDTLYDSGGPAWYYFFNENYIMTIDHRFQDERWLSFTSFNLEQDFDSLWLFAGSDTFSNLIGVFSGNSIPGTFSSPTGAFTLKFKSDNLQNKPGWMAVFHDGSIGLEERKAIETPGLEIYPNPASDKVNIRLSGSESYWRLNIYDLSGRVVHADDVYLDNSAQKVYQINIENWPIGVYHVLIYFHDGKSISSSLIRIAF